MDDRYAAWLQHVFAREVQDPAWYFDADSADFDANAETVAGLIALTMRRAGTDLARYTDGQVNQGLNYIFNSACSDIAGAVIHGHFPFGRKLEVIRSIAALYRDCFAPRCAEVLSHLDQPGATPLNRVCYMLWDVTPLIYWEKQPGKAEAYSAILEVLESALFSPNPACVESSLHGLGHLHCYAAAEVETLVQRFLSKPHIHNPKLLQYAQNARVGRVL